MEKAAGAVVVPEGKGRSDAQRPSDFRSHPSASWCVCECTSHASNSSSNS